ncbi:MAG: AAA family ATPase [Acidobacteriota bacterium]|nr:AAA family ATPase [Acidobacteriota bacterium]
MLDLPGYRILAQLHEGEVTRVFRARRIQDGEKVILKVLKPAFPTVLEVARFRWEYEVTREVGYGVLGLERWGNGLIMVLKDIDAAALSQISECRNMDLGAFLSLAVRITQSLVAIHRLGYMHKDINPANIIWSKSGNTVRIIDFGLAGKMVSEVPAFVTPMRLEGTPAYMSPEQTGRLNRPLDMRTDLYSMGATFYALLTGLPPFSGSDALTLVHAHLALRPKLLHEVKPEIPPVISNVVDKLLAKQPSDRYQSSFGLLADLGRCLDAYQRGRELELEAGAQDYSDKLHIPGTLYDRKKEQEQLEAVRREVNNGAGALVLVTGPVGIGKTMLVREMRKTTDLEKGLFIEGRYEEMGRPYLGLSRAFSQLARILCSDSEDRRAQLRKSLTRELDGSLRLLVDLAPEMEAICGRWPPLPELEPGRQANHFYVTIQHFLKVICTAERPLVIFLDDFHHADAAGVNLVRDLMSYGQSYLMLILAFREDVWEGSPAAELASKARKHIVTATVRPKPLGYRAVSTMVGETLKLHTAGITELSERIMRWSSGNPLFVHESMEALYRAEVIRFDYRLGRWVLNQQKLEDFQPGRSAAGILIESLNEIPRETRELLRVGACLGNTFCLDMPAQILNSTARELGELLAPAVNAGVLRPLGDAYRVLGGLPEEEAGGHLAVRFRFVHDRVREALYEELGDSAEQLHLQIGRALRAGVEQENHMETAYHLNRALDRIVDSEERTLLAGLDLVVAKKLMSEGAFQRAIDILHQGCLCLTEETWHKDFSLAWSLKKNAARAAFLVGREDEGIQLCSQLLKRTEDPIARAEIHALEAVYYTGFGKSEQAIDSALQGLAGLGIALTRKVSRFRIWLEIKRIARLLRHCDPEQFEVTTGELTPRIRACLELTANLALPTYFSRYRNLYLMASLWRARQCFKYRAAGLSAHALVSYAVILNNLGEHKQAEKYGQTALRLTERPDLAPSRPRVLFVYAAMLLPWFHHWKFIRPYLLRAAKEGFRYGELLYGTLAANCIVIWEPTMTLKQRLEESRNALEHFHGESIMSFKWMARILIQSIKCRMGLTRGRFSLTDAEFDEDEEMRFLDQVKDYHKYMLYAQKGKLMLLHGAYDDAVTWMRKARRYYHAVAGTAEVVELDFFGFLAETQRLEPGSPKWTRSKRKRLKKWRKDMQRYASRCPVNFAHKHMMMAAETARLDNNPDLAEIFYRDAVQLAHKNEFRAEEAMSNELAARFYMGRNLDHVAAVFLRQADYLYERWGAAAKCEQLREAYGKWFEILPHTRDRSTYLQADWANSLQPANLDLVSVIKAARALSEEIVLDRLLLRLMAVVRENAGAQKAVLCLVSENRLVIRAEADEKEERNLPEIPLESPEANELVPLRLLRAVTGTMETHVPDLQEHCLLTRDSYFSRNNPRSAACIPLVKRARPVGVIYLENRLVAGAFSKQRIEILELLAADAAVAIENARLVAGLEEVRRSLEEKVAFRTTQLTLRNQALEAKNRELEAFDEIVKDINRHIDLDNVLQSVLEMGVKLIPQVQRGSFLFWNEKENQFEYSASVGYSARGMRNFTLSLDEFLEPGTEENESVAEGIYLVHNFQKCNLAERFSGTEVPQSLIIIFVEVDNTLIGFLSLDNMEDPRGIESVDRRRLVRFREHVVTAIAKARLLREVQNQKEAIVRAQEQMVIQEKMASLGNMTAGVAHEINNPANFVNGGAQNLESDLHKFRRFILELAGDETDPAVLAAIEDKLAPLHQHVSLIKEGTSRISRIVQDLRAITRKDPKEYQLADITEILDATVNLVRSKYADHVTFATSMPAGLFMECHPAELGQVFMNLIVNACQAITCSAGKRGTVDIQAHEEDEDIVVCIRDDGMGMSEEVRERIFEPFFTTKPVGMGTGLGMSITFGIIKKHAGSIEVRSVEHAWTSISVHLPKKHTDVEEIEIREMASEVMAEEK